MQLSSGEMKKQSSSAEGLAISEDFSCADAILGGLVRRVMNEAESAIISENANNLFFRMSPLSSARLLLATLSRLTEHWGAESVPRAVASVAPASSLLQEPRSLPLAVLIRKFRPQRSRKNSASRHLLNASCTTWNLAGIIATAINSRQISFTIYGSTDLQ